METTPALEAGVLRRVDPYRWEIPPTYKPGMRVPGLIYADETLLTSIAQDQAIEQVANVATLPGIVGQSLAMPDIHWGYGFPIGGVAAMRADDGVISPGGIGYDICCGVRLLATDLDVTEVRTHLPAIADMLYRTVPAGVGERSRVHFAGRGRFDQMLREGARWAVEEGYGNSEDLDRIEEGGALTGADPGAISQRARERGLHEVGSLGSGNHFLEVQRVDEVYDEATASAFGLHLGQLTVFIHTGSRGFGHQVCTDALHVMQRAVQRYGIDLPDRQLACVPIRTPEGRDYLAAMACAANYAWANRQCITHAARRALQAVLGDCAGKVRLVYDVAHNLAKFETYDVDGKPLEVCVHRKGATRAFPPGHPDLHPSIRPHGQPVLIPGDMGRYSYVAVGTEQAMRESFGSTCHGAGRALSRHAAKRALEGVDIAAELRQRGITVRARNPRLLAEEASAAYKDVADVVNVVENAGLSRKVARLRPLVVIKG
ncbi:MAG TPA: RtcB family protein [Chloroflexota bacterium]|nr:RtcB family protein [Chloroflexota bacterium]